MRLEWIEDLLAVIDAGSLSSAAQKRFSSQSAFTRRVRVIEQALGCELFDRSTRPVQLRTHVMEQEGEMRRAVVRLNALKNALADPREASRIQVSFACQHTIATTISPRLIRELTRGGHLNVRVRSSDRDACLMMLLSSRVDFALIFDTLEESAGREKGIFLEETLGTDCMIPVMATDFEEEIRDAMAHRVLPVIAFPRDVYLGQLFEDSFLARTASEYQIKRTAETGLTLAALHYTLEGIGIGWLPRSIAAEHIEQGRLLDISDHLPTQELRIKIVRLCDNLSELAERVWNQIAVEYRRLEQAAGKQTPPSD